MEQETSEIDMLAVFYDSKRGVVDAIYLSGDETFVKCELIRHHGYLINARNLQYSELVTRHMNEAVVSFIECNQITDKVHGVFMFIEEFNVHVREYDDSYDKKDLAIIEYIKKNLTTFNDVL